MTTTHKHAPDCMCAFCRHGMTPARDIAAPTGERGKYHLRIEPGHHVPQAGDAVTMQGMLTYSVRIHRVIVQTEHAHGPGVTLMTVDGTRRVVEQCDICEAPLLSSICPVCQVERLCSECSLRYPDQMGALVCCTCHSLLKNTGMSVEQIRAGREAGELTGFNPVKKG